MPLIQNLVSKFFISSLLILVTIPVKAQITPDKTLGAEASRLTPNILINGLSSDRIDGGAQRGSNLFHSFTDFNVGNRQRVYFSNPSDVTNILTRVTGGNASNILGILGVNGNANLFLINPNGIIFGSNASLDVRGSFVGTTANAVEFGNQGVFSATNPQTPPLLTIDPSALFFNQVNQTAAITNQSQAPAGVDLTGSNVTGLRVPDGKSLLLVGGNVNLDGGGLTANGGRIELAGLAAPGMIGLNLAGDTLSLSLPNDVQLGDISLNNQALVVAYGAGGGDVVINAHNLDISNSYLLAGIVAGLPDGSSKAGDIKINADSISLFNGGEIANFTAAIGNAGNIFISARNAISLDGGFINSNILPGAVGRGGDINIQAGNISLTKNGIIGSNSAGNGDSGNIFIKALNAISLDGGFITSGVLADAVGRGGDVNIQAGNVSLTNGGAISSSIFGQGSSGTVNVNVGDALTVSGTGSLIAAFLDTGAVGSAGDINIQAGNVSLLDGGVINSNSYGQGNSGNVNINVRDALTIDGIYSGIFANFETSAVGRGGDINIQAGNVSLTNGAGITSATFGNGDSGNISITARNAISLDNVNISNNVQGDAVGNAGNIDITTGSLSVTNGAQINSFTRGTGNAGNITIIASDAVTYDGVNSNEYHSGSYTTVNPGAVGNGGNINVTARSFSLTNGGELVVSVINEAFNTLPSGQGIAGNINIKADTLRLSKSIIAAQAVSSDGGNINLNLSDYLLLRHNSQISTNAGTAQAGGNGGNININTPFIVAAPNENSDITANAFSGKGGNIDIKAQSFFGIEARPQTSNQTNDITASSQLGLQGQVAITLPQVQPTQGINKLPSQVIDASKQINQSCPRSLNAKPLSKFIITGHGSLPPSPLELMVGTTTRIPLATLDDKASGNPSPQISSIPSIPATSPTAMIEAQGWMKTADGKILLVAYAPNTTPSFRPTVAGCPVPN
ncbi:MAG: S-layer family protein [Nostoc sp.]|uniref:S-layer family protein n=1 Tax=Nostoc sp. TaxID=1180 RepID=UPI002FF55972